MGIGTDQQGAVAVVGTFDSKGQEHLFLKKCIERRGLPVLTLHVGTKAHSLFPADWDLYETVILTRGLQAAGRDVCISAVLAEARRLVRGLYDAGRISGIMSAGGGTGTHLCAGVMRALPMGVPKVMVTRPMPRNP